MIDRKSYVVLVKTVDKRYSFDTPFYRIDFKVCNGFRELRDYIIKCNFADNEYMVYELTDIKIKKEAGKAL